MLNVELLKKAGLDQDTIDRLVKEEQRKAFEEKIKKLFSHQHVKGVVKLVSSLDFPCRIVIEKRQGEKESTLKISSPSSGTRGNSKNGQKVVVNGKEYPSFKAVCDDLGLEVNRDSARRVLERNNVQYTLA